MRLTPSWLCATSSEPEDDSDEPETETVSGVTIYHDPLSARSNGEAAAEFVPESDSELVSALDEMETPVTVDEVADELIHPARPSVETWAAVHERLHEHRLPELDAKGQIEFDAEQGLVDRRTVRLDAATRTDSSWLRRGARRLIRLTLLAILCASALALVIVAVALVV